MKRMFYPNRNHHPRLKTRSIQKFLIPILFWAGVLDFVSHQLPPEIFAVGQFRFVYQIIGLPQNFNPLLAPAA